MSLLCFTGFSCGILSDELAITNPNYPNVDENAGNCDFRLLVNSHHVFQIRVEFRESRMFFLEKKIVYISIVDRLRVNYGRLKSPALENNLGGTQLIGRHQLSHVDFKINTKAVGFPFRSIGTIKTTGCVKSIDNSCTLALVYLVTKEILGSIKPNPLAFLPIGAGVGKKACDYLWISSRKKGVYPVIHTINCGSTFSERRGDFRHRIIMARMPSTSVKMMIFFHTGAPRHFNASDHGPGFRIDFEQIAPIELLSIYLTGHHVILEQYPYHWARQRHCPLRNWGRASGDKAMKAATRSTVVMGAGAGGFLVGGPVGAVTGGTAAGSGWDLVVAAATDGNEVNGIAKIIDDPTNVDSYFDAGTSLVRDAGVLAGLSRI
ncbi:hypothetical protein DAPPUDRAFT_335437 [Daphnia pulex]|uniref:CUB domain-containing protein n=1 Tax=Daphnia pulex TaxID=6669 RepID=E9HXS5_DAPPU|nr:hypothetical protein DAPPUDRAFT_335437 [Daphnia pulex]|eukprot:EFX63456.1 hypothetical protein DAPPUDRAFT_335437 [Daphnia pulex]